MLERVKKIISVDPADIIADARSRGLDVQTTKDFRRQPHKYWRIEDLMNHYADSAARNSSIGGFTAGFGGLPTVVALGSADLTNMAAQLYRLAQRLAILNGFDIDSPLEQEKAHQIYLTALGFDSAAQAVLRQQMASAAAKAGKPWARSNYVIKLILAVAQKLGVTITTKQAGKLIPIVGGAIGATVNYQFAKSAGQKMIRSFKDEYFRTWQAGGDNEEPQ
jgi:hypothetical protein